MRPGGVHVGQESGAHQVGEVGIADAEDRCRRVPHVELAGGGSAGHLPPVHAALEGEPAVQGPVIVPDDGQVAAAGKFGSSAGVDGDRGEASGEVLLGAGGADVGHRAHSLFDVGDAGDGGVEHGCGPSAVGHVGAEDQAEALGAFELPLVQAGAVGELHRPVRGEGFHGGGHASPSGSGAVLLVSSWKYRRSPGYSRGVVMGEIRAENVQDDLGGGVVGAQPDLGDAQQGWPVGPLFVVPSWLAGHQ